ncbi:FAD/NAD(P)-binding protein [Paraburkholderia solisilvae]|uniref:FAD-dependent urate hydroxylase HpyO/Asp monooxygenase CreE-like FAD/NAD(P)-binding domain-containing protein n=1 Tax=Paraburkholderia solisilvae TaxID=624376 RepID=A0A6J5DP26_9BURK|nr:FAD/NAD(P)-binding protein [Paraburkholderia solisilvae]CAB3755693.1 hypothetical protein LMG29739_02251 [Paraburkholderia solisilvae]
MMTQSRTLAIVGGGAAGVATFIAMVRRRAAKTIYIIEPRPIGAGIVFGSLDEDLLCNTSVAIMSVIQDNPDDFLDYLRAKGRHAMPETFAPRAWVGEYLTDRFREYTGIAAQYGIDVIDLPYRFQSLRVIDERAYSLKLSDTVMTRSITVSAVVFCTGFGAPRVPEPLKCHAGHRTLIGCPYPERDMLKRIPADSRVLVVGSRLSAIDTAVLLGREQHRVAMVSPSGTLPAVRANSLRNERYQLEQASLEALLTRWKPGTATTYPAALKHAYLKYVARQLCGYVGKSWRKHFAASEHYDARLRDEIALAERGQNRWQDLLVDLVEKVNATYTRSEPRFDGGFHPAFAESIERYLTAVALPNAKKLMSLIDEGRLTVNKGRLICVDVLRNERAPWRVDWGDGPQRFDALVLAAGFHLPQFVVNDAGELEISENGEGAKAAVGVSRELRADSSRLPGATSIWFIGPPAHARVPMPNALFVVAAQAERVAAALAGNGQHAVREASPA